MYGGVDVIAAGAAASAAARAVALTVLTVLVVMLLVLFPRRCWTPATSCFTITSATPALLGTSGPNGLFSPLVGANVKAGADY